ncbi:MAG: sugar phosphate isomerase/epimerase [Candidatus Poribacteria bacterium]|nr:sugar phosphate isomerase/epimerase [Candidatus Poribacteria bacterium]
MHIGCCAYSYRQYLSKGDMTLEGFFDIVVGLDLDGVEMTAYYFPNTERDTLYDVKRMALRRGLEISGTAVGNNFCRADAGERAKQVQMVKDWIGHSVTLGAPLIRVFAGGTPDGHTEDEARGWTIAALQECAEVAAEHGVMLALENHGGITSTVEQVEALLNGVDSEWLAVNLDTGNYRTDPYGSIERTTKRAITCHLKSEVPTAGGKEDADVDRIVAILKGAGYRGYASIEYEAQEDPMTGVPKFVKELIRAIR